MRKWQPDGLLMWQPSKPSTETGTREHFVQPTPLVLHQLDHHQTDLYVLWEDQWTKEVTNVAMSAGSSVTWMYWRITSMPLVGTPSGPWLTVASVPGMGGVSRQSHNATISLIHNTCSHQGVTRISMPGMSTNLTNICMNRCVGGKVNIRGISHGCCRASILQTPWSCQYQVKYASKWALSWLAKTYLPLTGHTHEIIPLPILGGCTFLRPPDPAKAHLLPHLCLVWKEEQTMY